MILDRWDLLLHLDVKREYKLKDETNMKPGSAQVVGSRLLRSFTPGFICRENGHL
jgi:hypothetical protein